MATDPELLDMTVQYDARDAHFSNHFRDQRRGHGRLECPATLLTAGHRSHRLQSWHHRRRYRFLPPT